MPIASSYPLSAVYFWTYSCVLFAAIPPFYFYTYFTGERKKLTTLKLLVILLLIAPAFALVRYHMVAIDEVISRWPRLDRLADSTELGYLCGGCLFFGIPTFLCSAFSCCLIWSWINRQKTETKYHAS